MSALGTFVGVCQLLQATPRTLKVNLLTRYLTQDVAASLVSIVDRMLCIGIADGYVNIIDTVLVVP